MAYVSFSTGFKPGGTNLTYGYADDNAPPMVFQTFEPETVDSVEFGLKTDFLMETQEQTSQFSHMTMKIYNSKQPILIHIGAELQIFQNQKCLELR